MVPAHPIRDILIQIFFYILFLWFASTVVSFIISMIGKGSCCTGPVNAYEHFQDVNTVNRHINDSFSRMNVTLDNYIQQLQDTMAKTGSMKANTCILYNSVHDKYIKSLSKEVENKEDLQLPQDQQDKMAEQKAKTAETSWLQQIFTYSYFRKGVQMLDCTKVDVSSANVNDSDMMDAMEGFQNVDPSSFDSQKGALFAKAISFAKLINSDTVKGWLNDCKGITGTAGFLNVYINNISVKAKISRCINDYTKGVNNFKNKSEEEQGKITQTGEMMCNAKFSSQLENFQDASYMNPDFTFPVPFPTSGLNEEQINSYKALSFAQDVLSKYSTTIGDVYKNTVAQYTIMDNTNKTFIAYQKQIDSVVDKNYSKEEAQNLQNNL